ncbi:hypothetical protein Hanom_Chr16g01471221 [Helianthus anomalus]
MVWMFIYKKLRFLYLCNRRSNPSRIGLFYQFYLSISSSYQIQFSVTVVIVLPLLLVSPTEPLICVSNLVNMFIKTYNKVILLSFWLCVAGNLDFVFLTALLDFLFLRFLG